MMASHNILRVMSYNSRSRGMNVMKIEYLKSLLSTCDLLFLQEHWFCDAHVQSLSSVNSDFLSCGVCGFDSHRLSYKGDLLAVVPFCGVKSFMLIYL